MTILKSSFIIMTFFSKLKAPYLQYRRVLQMDVSHHHLEFKELITSFQPPSSPLVPFVRLFITLSISGLSWPFAKIMTPYYRPRTLRRPTLNGLSIVTALAF